MPEKRRIVVEAARDLARSGLNRGSAGNVSLRDGDTLLITPSGVAAAELEPQMIARMALAGEGAHDGPLPPSSEWRFHLDIMRARPDVRAIVHTHSTYATTLAVLRKNLPAIHYMIAALGGPVVRCAGYAPYGTAELSRLALGSLGDMHAVLLGGHGAITVGDTMKRALWRAGELEELAKIYHLAMLAGEPEILSDAEVAATVARFADYGVRDAH